MASLDFKKVSRSSEGHNAHAEIWRFNHVRKKITWTTICCLNVTRTVMKNELTEAKIFELMVDLERVFSSDLSQVSHQLCLFHWG
jgi:hypothetical protein